MKPIKCHCCGDAKHVTGLDGKPRPCSRCNVTEFHAWSKARRPVPQEKPAPPLERP